MRTRESFLTLIAELEGAYQEFGRAMAQNRRAGERIQNGADDPIDWGALGFTLHSAYGVLENYFLRVSKFFENDPGKTGTHIMIGPDAAGRCWTIVIQPTAQRGHWKPITGWPSDKAELGKYNDS